MDVRRIANKIRCEIYRFLHPCIWGKRLQINGIPIITDFSRIELGTDVSVNDGVYIQSRGGVVIGNNVTISRGVYILTEGLDTLNYLENSRKRYRDHIAKKVIIGNGTWIAAGTIVCPGVEIAANSIIGGGSVVSKSLTDEGAIYGGVPAKKIKEITS